MYPYSTLDGWILTLLPALACYFVLSGLDDLFVDVAWLVFWLRDRFHRAARAGPAPPLPERRIAVFLPLWQESGVIGAMLTNNVAAIRYSAYAFFAGAYPNDRPTIDAIRELQPRIPNLHLALCPHNGPTSKADCLNWIYRHLLDYERHTGECFHLVLVHDAEDILHPDSLRRINQLAATCDFIQIPVLALHTPLRQFTHGVYCDEFAEFQTRDLPVRNRLGGFVPSAGVGTAYSRAALDALAYEDADRIFEPDCLTEDYEAGRHLHDLGFRQHFLAPCRSGGTWLATREYFPQHLGAAIRQRTRWVSGIALQGWARRGWSGDWNQLYWTWRDRKGLIGSPLGLLTNLLTAYIAASGLWFRASLPPVTVRLLWFTLTLQVLRSLVRMACCARFYGWTFAALSPLRALWANAINATATVRALEQYARARWSHTPLAWLKTSHAYPTATSIAANRRPLGEVLVDGGRLSPFDLRQALATQPPGVRLGEWLVANHLLTLEEVYRALSIQQGIPLGAPHAVSRRAARTLPAHVLQRWHVLPFQVTRGRLLVAASDVPSEALQSTLSTYTTLDVRFHLVTPEHLETMRESIQ